MELPDLLARWGIPLVFAAALAEQAGLPLPAAPILVTAGALAWDGALRPEAVLVAALAACVVADHAWFVAGRLRGRALLAGICRLSLSPDTCVRRTDDLIARHGAEVLMVAKFVPGISAVAIPTAAAMGISYRRFILFDGVGSLAWCVAYVAAGMIFSRQVNDVLDVMGRVGGWSLAAVAALFAAYIGAKVHQRRRLRHLYRLVRIGPHEVAAMLASREDLLILDARSSLARTEDPRTFPLSISFDLGDTFDLLPEDARGKTIVTFCTCPNEASAALLAARLIKAGYGRVRVLTGGEEALALLAVAA
jgi:membrane protein DedA with SNARE-associated domain/rhodanese-related sulfurtransferase